MSEAWTQRLMGEFGGRWEDNFRKNKWGSALLDVNIGSRAGGEGLICSAGGFLQCKHFLPGRFQATDGKWGWVFMGW